MHPIPDIKNIRTLWALKDFLFFDDRLLLRRGEIIVQIAIVFWLRQWTVKAIQLWLNPVQIIPLCLDFMCIFQVYTLLCHFFRFIPILFLILHLVHILWHTFLIKTIFFNPANYPPHTVPPRMSSKNHKVFTIFFAFFSHKTVVFIQRTFHYGYKNTGVDVI